MKTLTYRRSLSLLIAAALLSASLASAATPAPLKPRSATASSTHAKYPASKAIDGVISDDSRWVSETSTPESPAWLEINLGAKRKLAGVHLFTGYGKGSALQNFAIQFFTDGKWQDIPSAVFTDNKSMAIAIPFDDTVQVVTDRLRLRTSDPVARVKEIVVWPAEVGDLPPIAGAHAAAAPVAQPKIPLIYLNQSGFNLNQPKRFTAPTLPDGTQFIVRPAQGGAALFEGTIASKKGDFSPFNPDDTREFVVEAGGLTSVPFRIGIGWLERVTYQNAVNFMIDSRHYLGNFRGACPGSFGWRDDHHFGWELHTLIPQYLSNPSAYDRMPRQISYEKPSNPKLWGALQPPSADAPDIVKLIHWGADVIVTQQLSHELLKSQLAYFLYAWPMLEKHLPAQNYQVVRDYTFAHWTDEKSDRKYPYDASLEHNLLALKTAIGSTKGQYPPGFSVQPNLLLYEVAKRENRPDADRYLKAACAQAEWMIANLDWNDPLTTKGQRMSEFITITGLAHLQRMYPDRAPAGLVDKINAWAKVVIRRSDNLWDFRKLDDADKWTPMGEKPTMWNEPGNVVGLPASLLAAIEVLPDPATKARLQELVYSHMDNCFGRNPTGRHFSYDAPKEIEGVEFGWFSFLPGGIGRLADARFVIDGSPKDAHYPYHPEKGNIGWTEGWIQFNTPFNLSLAYLAYTQTALALTREGDDLLIRLQAPLNFDYTKVETGTVMLTASTGAPQSITVTEESPNSRFFSARVKAPQDAEVSYGYGYLGHRATPKP